MSACRIAAIAAGVGPIAPQITPSAENPSMMALVSKLCRPDRGAASSSSTDRDGRRLPRSRDRVNGSLILRRECLVVHHDGRLKKSLRELTTVFGKISRCHLGALSSSSAGLSAKRAPSSLSNRRSSYPTRLRLSRLMCSPSPRPPGFLVKPNSKMASRSRTPIPGPESCTSIIRSSASSRIHRALSGFCWDSQKMALSTRFTNAG